jgi:hypothetical protein
MLVKLFVTPKGTRFGHFAQERVRGRFGERRSRLLLFCIRVTMDATLSRFGIHCEIAGKIASGSMPYHG